MDRASGAIASSGPIDRDSFPETLKRRAESALGDPCFDFIATYHAVADLRSLAKKTPGVLDSRTFRTIARLLQSNRFKDLRQSYFLFREAASVITDVAVTKGYNELKTQALACLTGLLRKTHGSAHRGVAEALGSLPVGVTGPPLTGGSNPFSPAVAWSALLASKGLRNVGAPWYIGRSLVVRTEPQNRLLVVKLAKRDDTAADLASEIEWMTRLKQPAWTLDRPFHIPDPLTYKGRRILRIKGLPLPPPVALDRHPERLAIAFLAHPNYFVYPNQQGITGEAAREMLGRNAYLMGGLTAKGVIHEAPIPLFHNRTQRMRRDDQGRYQWYRSGRLDQWLDSCAYPNLGLSGLRDFEHLESSRCGGRRLYRRIGNQLLSLLLVAGSHFRCRERRRAGLDAEGNPVDARDLFDRPLLRQMVEDIFINYHAGFADTRPSTALPVDLDHLTRRMVEEMGVDRYMTELLRRNDQEALSDFEFKAFLKTRGYSDAQIAGLRRGEKDLLISSGPHLGNFNRQISLPELIESVAAMAAVCMAGRYRSTAFQTPSG